MIIFIDIYFFVLNYLRVIFLYHFLTILLILLNLLMIFLPLFLPNFTPLLLSLSFFVPLLHSPLFHLSQILTPYSTHR